MRHYRQLTQEERYQITALKGLGYTQRQIARETGRSPSTISWELRRNRGIEGYQAETAQRVAYRRRREAGKRHKRTPELIAWVEARLRDDWSPEQIAGSLREAGYPLVSHEWIYRHQACLRPRDRFWVSRPAESHRQPLAEPYVTLSRHTAPIIRPFACPLQCTKTCG